MQINHKDRMISIQLDFDPNFTTELLINSLLELVKIQGSSIYLVTYDNEILMPNIKIIDLILLNPKKYKNLRLLSSYEEYNSISLNLQSNNLTKKNENYEYNHRSKSELNLEDNYSYINRENVSRPSYNNYDKKELPSPSEESYKFNNYKSKDDDLLLSMNSNEDFNNLDSKKDEKNYLNSIAQNTTNQTNNLNIPSYKNYLNDTKYSSNKFGDEQEKPEKKSYNYKEKLTYLDKDSMNRSKDNLVEDYNFDKNILNNKTFDRSSNNHELGNNNSSTPTETSGKYNYSERLKEDLNRQRFMSEKRTFRNNNYNGKLIII